MHLEKLATAVTCVLATAIPRDGSMPPQLEQSPAAVEVRCDTPNVVVHSSHRSDASIVCGGARDAMTFLASQALQVDGPVSIDVVEVLPSEASESAAGCYLTPKNRAVVLAYSEFRKRGTWFGIAIDPGLYRSLVAHEVAHSIAAANFEIARPAVQAHEYIAYVTMFATMAPAQRERVLSNYAGSGFENDAQMSSTIYLFDPMRFGVQAYRHFLGRASGRDYLHAVLAGNALVE